MGVFKAGAAAAVGAVIWFVLSAALAPSAAAAPANVARVMVEPTSTGLHLVVVSPTPLVSHTFFLSGERPRFVVDLPTPDLDVRPSLDGVRLALGVRSARRDAQHARVVIDLRQSARLLNEIQTRSPNGWRTVYNLAPTSAPAPVVDVAPSPVFEPIAARVPTISVPAAKVVVIDAGHGGRDSGAVGADGREEKSFTLAAALALQEDLQARGYKVVLTRDHDVFVTLADRVKVARDAKADLFISLHADSSTSHAAQGASIYTLSQSGSARAKSLMDSQDWRVDLGDAPRTNAVDDILVDLTQRETTSRSGQFARVLTRRLGDVTTLAENTHRSASFFVLLAPDVPAVLLEMGFVTHRGDEARLGSPQSREAMMQAVADSIDEQLAPPRARSYAEANAADASFGRLRTP